MSSRMQPSRRALCVALAVPPFAWFLHQIGTGFAIRLSCELGAPPFGTAAGVGALLACAIVAWIAWPAAHGAPGETSGLLARLALGCAAVFALAIAFQTAATMIEAPCFH